MAAARRPCSPFAVSVSGWYEAAGHAQGCCECGEVHEGKHSRHLQVALNLLTLVSCPSCAGGRAQKRLRVEGGAAFNGQPLTKALKRRVGFVMQVGRAQRGMYPRAGQVTSEEGAGRP